MQRFSGPRLTAARKAAGKSREQAAIETKRSYSSWTLYERGIVEPPLAVIYAIADCLACDVFDLFEEVERAAS